MNCINANQLIHAYIDHELDAEHALRLEAHLDGCNTCHQLYTEFTELRTSIKQARLYKNAPTDLSNTIFAKLDNPSLKKSPSTASPQKEQKQARRKYIGYGITLAASLMLGVILTNQFLEHREETRLISAILTGHSNAISANRLTDIEANRIDRLNSWFAGKLNYSPRIYDFSQDGFRLIGGRLDTIQDQRIASLTYKHQHHVVNLYTWPSPDVDDAEQELHQLQGYQLLYWCQDKMNYWIVSDLDKNELELFAGKLQIKLK